MHYAGSQEELILTVLEPQDGSTVGSRVLTISGFTAPDAEVAVNDLIPALPDPLGEWEANLLLQPGLNIIRVAASRGAETTEQTITVTYQP